jgi:hypothetical protein
MIDRSHTEKTLTRVGIIALTYPPPGPGDSIDTDVAWCLQPLAALDDAQLAVIRQLIRDTITDPTAHRAALVRELANLSDD